MNHIDQAILLSAAFIYAGFFACSALDNITARRKRIKQMRQKTDLMLEQNRLLYESSQLRAAKESNHG